MTKVIKFGGSSLANGEQVAKVINIIKEDEQRHVIVVSAPGKRFDEDTKVTDLLIQYANAVTGHQDTTDIVKKIIVRYREIGQYFDLTEQIMQPIFDQISELQVQKYPNDEYLMADFKAHGEMLNAQLIAKVLKRLDFNARFVDPKKVGIVLSDDPNDAMILEETYVNLGNFEYDPEEYLVFPGFFGRTKSGETATFARGGSDITGSIVACGLNIDTYENFTDVDSIYTANPKVIAHPEPIQKMSYQEMRELSYAGFSVFNDEAIIPAIKGNVTINVKNTNHPSAKGTFIIPTKGYHPAHPITGIAGSKHFSALYFHKYLLNKQVGFTLKVLKILAKYDVPYEHMPSGIDDLTIVFDKKNLTEEKVDHIIEEVQNTVHPDLLNWISDYAIIMVVGEGLYDDPNSLSKIIDSLTEDKININMINQGASQTSLMLGTSCEDANHAIKQIYNQFFDSEVVK